MMRFVARFAALVLVMALHGTDLHGADCNNGVLAVRGYSFGHQPAAAVVQYAAPIYQAQTLYLVGAPYRAQSLASHAEAAASDAADARLLRRFQAFLQAEATLAEEFKVTGGVLANRCAKCHTAESPGGGIVLDGTEALTAEQKNAVMRSVLSGEMPKDLEPLAAEERDELAKLLFLGDW